MKALAVDKVCLNCLTGPAESLSAAVKERLAVDYPFDKATGYCSGRYGRRDRQASVVARVATTGAESPGAAGTCTRRGPLTLKG